MTSKLSKTVSTVLIRLLDQYLQNPEICWHFKIFICGSKFSKIEFGRFRLEIRFLSLVLGSLISLMLKPHYIGISFFREGVPTPFFKVTLIWLFAVQNVFLTIHYDVSGRLGYVWDIFDTIGSQKLIFIARFSIEKYKF